jgi:hypothetical protein
MRVTAWVVAGALRLGEHQLLDPHKPGAAPVDSIPQPCYWIKLRIGILHKGSNMALVSKAKSIGLLVLCLGLCACATNDYVSQLSQANFGLRVRPSVNVDSSALMNGPYGPAPSQAACAAADYSCSPQVRLRWGDSAPRW